MPCAGDFFALFHAPMSDFLMDHKHFFFDGADCSIFLSSTLAGAMPPMLSSSRALFFSMQLFILRADAFSIFSSMLFAVVQCSGAFSLL